MKLLGALYLALGLVSSSVIVHGATPDVEAFALRPLITTSELVVGTNRFAFGLLKDEKLLAGADVGLRLFAIEGDQTRLATELNAPYRSIASVQSKKNIHRHADGSHHVHNDNSVQGLYVTELSFDRAGPWGLEVRLRGKASDDNNVARFAVDVLERSPTPAVGAAAPRSRNLIAADVKHLRSIDSSSPADIRLHRMRIADAIAQHRPQLIVFATPQFCTSRMCAPVVDIVRGLWPAYGTQVAITHQEIWQDFAAKKLFATVEEWRIETEPWVFVVDRDGIIRSKFEGLVTGAELESALRQVLRREIGRRQ